jgi:hypothetical protein
MKAAGLLALLLWVQCDALATWTVIAIDQKTGQIAIASASGRASGVPRSSEHLGTPSLRGSVGTGQSGGSKSGETQVSYAGGRQAIGASDASQLLPK